MISLEQFQILDPGQQKLEIEHVETLIHYTLLGEKETNSEVLKGQRERLEEFYTLLILYKK